MKKRLYYLLLACFLFLLLSCDVTDPKLGHNPPRKLKVEPGPGRASLSWERPKNPNNFFSGYYIYQNGSRLENKVTNITGKTVSYTIRDLPTGTYVYHVVASYATGVDSTPSNVVTVVVFNQ